MTLRVKGECKDNNQYGDSSLRFRMTLRAEGKARAKATANTGILAAPE